MKKKFQKFFERISKKNFIIFFFKCLYWQNIAYLRCLWSPLSKLRYQNGLLSFLENKCHIEYQNYLTFLLLEPNCNSVWNETLCKWLYENTGWLINFKVAPIIFLLILTLRPNNVIERLDNLRSWAVYLTSLHMITVLRWHDLTDISLWVSI